MSNSKRRIYYDHEPAWRHIRESGGTSWDDLSNTSLNDSYYGLRDFLALNKGKENQGGSNAIDFGCGGGQSSFLVAEQGWTVTAIDYSETAIDIAKSNAISIGNTSVCFSRADATDLSRFPSDTFDLCVDHHVLHCLIEESDRSQFLSEVARVLTDSGLFFSETMSREGEFDHQHFDVDPSSWTNRQYTRYWTNLDDLNNEYRSAGFEVVSQILRPQQDIPAPGEVIWSVLKLI